MPKNRKRLRADGSPYEIFINGKFFPPYEMFINGKAFPSRSRGGRYCSEANCLRRAKVRRRSKRMKSTIDSTEGGLPGRNEKKWRSRLAWRLSKVENLTFAFLFRGR